mgnify:CR=1 FL=1
MEGESLRRPPIIIGAFLHISDAMKDARIKSGVFPSTFGRAGRARGRRGENIFRRLLLILRRFAKDFAEDRRLQVRYLNNIPTYEIYPWIDIFPAQPVGENDFPPAAGG